MTFFAILCALLLEQARPLSRHNPVQSGVRQWAGWASRNLDAGKPHHGGIAWAIAVGLPAVGASSVYWWLDEAIGWPVAMLWSIAVLWLTLGFRQFSQHFTGIRDALDRGDEQAARELLAHWQQVDTRAVPRVELVRHVIEYSVIAAHRNVFGVLTWYVALAAIGLGPAGAVLYRLSEFVARYWRHRGSASGEHPASAALQKVARDCWHAIDWVPARLTAASFAVVGSFEEAIDGWRNHARQFPDDDDGAILAATAGAINVRLGGAALKASFAASSSQALEYDASAQTSIPTPGRDPEPAHLRIVVALVWRSVVMWMVLLALLTLARLLG
ncbi:MAG: CobD/CbiB family protein [Burkholderiales bacterium]